MNRIRVFLIVFLSLTAASLYSQKADKPKLVVGIVVDQMRHDYILRFWNDFGEDGFKKLIGNGLNCTQTHYTYIPTKTGPGHATIYTGSDPTIHGICGNDWYIPSKQVSINCVEDSSVEAGGENVVSGRSPANLMSENMADQLKMAHGDNSKVISISIKDRGAILPGGHQADGVFWYSSKSGNFVSSSYYLQELPAWVNKFNDEKWADQFLSMKWELFPEVKDDLNLVDNRLYEAPLDKKEQRIFPYDLNHLKEDGGYGLLKYTPYGNTITLKLAAEAILKEKLGKHPGSDLLMVSVSSTDYVGHLFGPYSKEIRDTYIRLDRDLAEFVDRLEKAVGKENFLLFLTADHGVMEIPEYLTENNIPAGRYSTPELRKDLNAYLQKKQNVNDAVLDISNFNLYFDPNKKNDPELLGNLKKSAIEYLNSRDFVKIAVDGELMTEGLSRDPLLKKASRGHFEGRSGDVVFITQPGWIASSGNTGTTHGSGYNYDSHVPLFFYGWNIKVGTRSQFHDVKDIAATICDALGISKPAGADGKVIPLR